jgi:hypothetical protein
MVIAVMSLSSLYLDAVRSAAKGTARNFWILKE